MWQPVPGVSNSPTGAQSGSVFEAAALGSGLVNQAELQAAASLLRASDHPPGGGNWDRALADQLVTAQQLTRYQADQLLLGNRKLSLGPYRIIDSLGQGGMGHVFKAEHYLMGRTVAVKVLPRSKSTPESIAGFAHEIRAQAQLDHQNLVRAYDAGHDGKVYFLVTEYVPGSDLRRLVRDRGPLTMSEAATIIAQAARGLDHAHRSGLVHRDVKPGNVLVAPDGHAKVSDLGLAGSLKEPDEDPRAGKVVGTADYLSPEQIMSPRSVTATSDIYSLGCTLYYAVTGKVPYPGGSPKEKAQRHCEDTPIHPRHFNPLLSDAFVEVIADMMEKDAKKRIQTAAQVIARLAPWIEEPAEHDDGEQPPAVGPQDAFASANEPARRPVFRPYAQDGVETPSQTLENTDPVASGYEETLPMEEAADESGAPAGLDPALTFVLAPVAVIFALLVLAIIFFALR